MKRFDLKSIESTIRLHISLSLIYQLKMSAAFTNGTSLDESKTSRKKLLFGSKLMDAPDHLAVSIDSSTTVGDSTLSLKSALLPGQTSPPATPACEPLTRANHSATRASGSWICRACSSKCPIWVAIIILFLLVLLLLVEFFMRPVQSHIVPVYQE